MNQLENKNATLSQMANKNGAHNENLCGTLQNLITV